MAAFNLLDDRKRDRRAPRRFGIMTSTPGMAGTGIGHMVESQIAAGNSEYAMVRAETMSNPAFADGEYYRQRAVTMSDRERRVKLHGEILPAEGAVFGMEFDPAQSLAHRWRFVVGRHRVQYNLAIDWGGSYHALLIEYDEAADVDVVIDEFIKDGVGDRAFCEYIAQSCKARWGIDRADIHGVWCDYNPKDARFEAYRWWKSRVHHRRVRNNNDRKARINTMRWRLGDKYTPRRLLFSPQLRKTRSKRPVLLCVQNYKWQERRVQGDNITMDRPIQDSLWSHAVDALGYYLWIRYGHLRFAEEQAA